MARPATADSPVRLFFAALPDATTRGHIAANSASLRLESTARLVLDENFHMTLAFVGAVRAAQMPSMRRIGGARRLGEFTLRFEALDYWPSAAAVVATAPQIAPSLHRLWRELRDELGKYGTPLDSLPFRPHVTLARKVSQAPVLQALRPFDWTVCEFCLMRSDTTGGQSAYTVVDTWSLLDNPAES